MTVNANKRSARSVLYDSKKLS